MKTINPEVTQKISNIFNTVVDMIYPRRCPLCGEILLDMEIGACKECIKKLEYLNEPVCKKCGKKIYDDTQEFCYDCTKKKHKFIQNKGVFVYKGDIQKSIYKFKYNNKREYSDFYVKEIIKSCGKWIDSCSADCLIPVPIYKAKQKLRGFNQAEVLAQKLGYELNIPILSDYLIRIKNTKPQKELNDTERKNNIKKAFKISKNIVKLNKIILIDDIYTTGSTIDEACKVLGSVGINEIYSLTLCIGKGD